MTISANAKNIRNKKYRKGKTYIVLQSPQKTKWKNIIRHMSRYIKATPHNHRLPPLPHSYLQIFRHIAQKLLEIRQYSCVVSIQSDEKSDFASARQWLCGVALNNDKGTVIVSAWYFNNYFSDAFYRKFCFMYNNFSCPWNCNCLCI